MHAFPRLVLTPEERHILLNKYRLGQCTADELARLDAWFATLADDETPVFTDGQHRQRVRDDIQARLMTALADEAWVRPLASVWRWGRVAAAVLLLVGGGGGLWLRLHEMPEPAMAETYVTVQSRAGQRKQLTLPDGSTVYLNAASKIRFPASFTGDTRPVFLTGEAFFAVTKNARKPFIVTTGNVQTRVLGTHFDVRAYAGDATLEVAVMEGKVLVKADSSSVTLLARQRAAYGLKTGRLSKESMPHTDAYLSWTQGELVFEQASLTEIAETLNRTYAVQITLAGAGLKTCRLDVRFKNEPIEQVLTVLCGYLNATYTRAGNRIVIRGVGCSS